MLQFSPSSFQAVFNYADIDFCVKRVASTTHGDFFFQYDRNESVICRK